MAEDADDDENKRELRRVPPKKIKKWKRAVKDLEVGALGRGKGVKEIAAMRSSLWPAIVAGKLRSLHDFLDHVPSLREQRALIEDLLEGAWICMMRRCSPPSRGLILSGFAGILRACRI